MRKKKTTRRKYTNEKDTRKLLNFLYLLRNCK